MYGQFDSREIATSNISTKSVETNSPAQCNLKSETEEKKHIWNISFEHAHIYTKIGQFMEMAKNTVMSILRRVNFINQIKAMLI